MSRYSMFFISLACFVKLILLKYYQLFLSGVSISINEFTKLPE